jgi:SAM-dependent methyltransferase
MFNLRLPDGSTVPMPATDGVISTAYGYSQRQKDGVANLLDDGNEMPNTTAEHYTQQWGPGISFLQFIKTNPQALSHMPSGQLGWPDLLSRIRSEANKRDILVYDAACGYGGLFSQLFAEPAPQRLRYLGADIHNSLATIERPANLPLATARFVRWDISRPLPVAELFDYVICRNALMHTPDPPKTLGNLVDRLAPNGTIAVSVYARKPLLREIIDDALRERIIPLPPAEAITLANQFTLLGRDLRKSPGRIVIQHDLPFFGIKAGEYDIQTFIYNHIIKCWYNDVFGEYYSDVVNFDWYHPPYAYRYTHDEICSLFLDLGLKITKTNSTAAQHYVEAVKATSD